MTEPSRVRLDTGIIEGREKCYLFCHENGDVELWGSKNLECRAVRVHPEVERIDFCETHHGLDYSGLRLVASSNTRHGPSLEDTYNLAVDLYLAAGLDMETSCAKAVVWITENLGRRSPYLLNDLSDPDLRVSVRKRMEQVEFREINEALHMTSEILSIRRRERDRSLRLAQGD